MLKMVLPLDDTRTLVDEFLNGKAVPTALAFGTVEAMQAALRAAQARSAAAGTRIDALNSRNPQPHKLPSWRA